MFIENDQNTLNAHISEKYIFTIKRKNSVLKVVHNK